MAASGLCGALLPAVPDASATTYVPITGAGSTWSGNAFADWTAGTQQYGMDVSYSGVGSTSGRQDFSNGTVTFGASEIPYGVKDGTITDPPPHRGYAYMPDTAGGTTFMYNLKIGNRRVTNLRLSGAAIAGIFTGVITNWDNPIIKHDNPGLTMPNHPIIPVVRSDGSGSTAEFTQWMLATEKSYWTAYCNRPSIDFHPCTQTSAYPVLPSGMVGAAGDLGVSGYVAQQQADGAIGYVEYSYALQTGFPVALVLNRSGYYTQPTAGHVAVSLLKAKVRGCSQTTGVCSNPTNDPLYLTQDLSGVYNDMDKRTYELSSYSYMILPTDTTVKSFTSTKGFALGAFGAYLLCQGQVPLDALGYSSLPINLVLAGFQQLEKVPGSQVPTTGTAQIAGCHNPTFDSSDTLGHNKLAETDPFPPACDKEGPTQCTAGTGGASKTSTPVNPSAAGSQPGGSNGTGSSGHNGSSGSGTGGGGSVPQNCSPDSNNCNQANGSGGNAAINGVPTSAAVSLGDGLKVALMALASALLLCLVVLPPVITQAGRRRRQRRGPGGMPGVQP